MDWDSRAGRSVRGMVCVSAQTGFRKAEFTMPKVRQACSCDCLSRANVRFFLRGRLYDVPPTEFLRNPRTGDYLVLTPPPSKCDPFDMVWALGRQPHLASISAK